MFSGDLRTLFPFLFFYPIQVKYVRRWVRVPLADGPFDSMAHTDAEAEAATAAMVLKRRGQVYVSKVKPEPESTADPTPADDRMKDDVASPLESDQQLPPKQAPSPSQLSANDGCYEAVAVDYSPGIKGRSSTKTATTDVSGATATTAAATAEPDKFALLILAGLTGGSSEGYVMDLVNAANRRGVDCYVMLGRGLAGVPNRSAAAFHGARTSDMRETARVIRRSLHPDTKLLAGMLTMLLMICVL
jgi:predicted alpha/beta-fold hydrolase